MEKDDFCTNFKCCIILLIEKCQKGGGAEKKVTSLKKKGGGVKMVFCLIGANRKLSFNNRSKNCTFKYDQA